MSLVLTSMVYIGRPTVMISLLHTQLVRTERENNLSKVTGIKSRADLYNNIVLFHNPCSNFPQYFSNSFYSLFLSVVVKTLDVSLSEAFCPDTISCSATLLYYTGFIVKAESYVKMRASRRERQRFIPSPPPTDRCGCPPYLGC